MSLARPARSVFGRCVASTRSASRTPPPSSSRCHQFHSSVAQLNRRPRFKNVKMTELGLDQPDKLAEYQREKFPDYTSEELEDLKKQYTPEQVEAIKVGEAAVDTKDIIVQGRLRADYHRPQNLDDYSMLDPSYDVRPESDDAVMPKRPGFKNSEQWEDAFGKKVAYEYNKKTTDQLSRAMVRALRQVKAGVGSELLDLTEDELTELESDPAKLRTYLVDEKEFKDADLDPSSSETMTREQAVKLDEAIEKEWTAQLEQISKIGGGAEIDPSTVELLEHGPAGKIGLHSAEKPSLGRVPGVEGRFHIGSRDKNEKQDKEIDAETAKVMRMSGMTEEQLNSVIMKSIVMRMVSNQTRLGKIRSYSIVAIAGNGNGRLGIGMAKSTEFERAESAAKVLALRNMKVIRRYENRTIYGNVKAKVSGTVVEIFSRPPGFGLRLPHRMFEMCRACGIHDLAVRIPRSKSPMNTVKAMYNALMTQPDPEAIAIGRGKKLVDARKVYYGGSVY